MILRNERLNGGDIFWFDGGVTVCNVEYRLWMG